MLLILFALCDALFEEEKSVSRFWIQNWDPFKQMKEALPPHPVFPFQFNPHFLIESWFFLGGGVVGGGHLLFNRFVYRFFVVVKFAIFLLLLAFINVDKVAGNNLDFKETRVL